MKKIVVDHPSFLPWIGFWHRVVTADIVVMTTGVPVSIAAQDHFHNRVRLSGGWLRVGVQKATRTALWKDVKIVRSDLPKAAKTIRNAFGRKTPYKHKVWAVADALDDYSGSDFLVDLNLELLLILSDLLGINLNTKLRFDSSIPDQTLSKTGRLLSSIGRFAQPPYVYCAGPAWHRYLDIPQANRAGVKVDVQTLLDPSEDTILSVLGSSDNPVQLIASSGNWIRPHAA